MAVDGEIVEMVTDFIFLGSKIAANGECSHEIKRRFLLGGKTMTKLDNILKSKDITLPTQVCLVKAMVFPVVMYGCESWTIKKAEGQRIDYFWTVMLEKSWESLGLQGNQTSQSTGDWSWIFTWMTHAEVESPILWSHDVKNWLIEKDPDAGKDWRQEEKGMTEDKMVGCLHRLDGHEFEQGLGAGDGQGSLVCCSPQGCKEPDMEWTTELELKCIK